MPKLYSFDFKQSVINSYINMNFSVVFTLQIFSISKSTLFNWIKLYRSDLLLPVQNVRSTYSSKLTQINSFLKSYVLKRKIFNVKTLKLIVYTNFKIHISTSSIYSILHKLNVTYKKFSKHIVKQNIKSTVNKFLKHVKSIDPTKIISIDESSFDIFISPSYGWSVKGKKVFKHFKYSQRKRITLTLAVTNNKIIAYNIIDGSSNLSNFSLFLSSFLPTITNYTLLMDNVNFHHSKSVINLVHTSSNSILYNVPYNPQTNPIECVFKIIKDFVKSKMVSVKTNIKKLICKSFKLVTPQKLKNIFNYSFKII